MNALIKVNPPQHHRHLSYITVLMNFFSQHVDSLGICKHDNIDDAIDPKFLRFPYINKLQAALIILKTSIK
jgi:hypothetical protein